MDGFDAKTKAARGEGPCGSPQLHQLADLSCSASNRAALATEMSATG